MRTVALYEMLFGILTIAGGAIGYFTAGSVPSLVTGLIAGIILVSSALKMQKGARNGLYVCLVVTVALLANFIVRLVNGGSFMPAGLMVTLSGISLVLLLLLLVQPKERKRIF